MLWTNRNGFFFVLDRATGQFLLGKPFVEVNWASGFDEKGRPQRVPGMVPAPQGTLILPGNQGGTNWYNPSYSPKTGLFYIPTWANYSSLYVKQPDEYVEGKAFRGGTPRPTTPNGIRTTANNLAKEDEGYGAIRAVDPHTGEMKWQFKMTDVTDAGVLTTASNLLFSGGREGYFYALDARDGKLLWKFPVGGRVISGPMTYSLGGRRNVEVNTGNSLFVFALCESLNYREWSGYYTVSAYETHHEHEYNAIRNAAALIDISPLFKYRIRGRDAMRLVDRVVTRDMRRVSAGQVIYTPWCDENGKVIDDGTVSRLDENTYRWTAADPNLRWFHLNARGMEVRIEDISGDLAALALQGPTSARLLKNVVDGEDISQLKYFHVAHCTIAGVPVDISRTGYTGDLGYEVWIPWKDGVKVWDVLMDKGRAFDIHPAGMLALDVARIEAGLLLIDIDFHSSKKAVIEQQKYSPFELGLARLVDLNKRKFVGQEALMIEAQNGHA